MLYKERLIENSKKLKNIACIGLDPIYESLREKSGNIEQDLVNFYTDFFNLIKENDLIPASFKPNIGYFSVLDKPFLKSYPGSNTLSFLITYIRENFKNSTIILDSKRADIARSSQNYSREAFEVWNSNATTISPYMGDDSIEPFLSYERGVYILNKTSNPYSYVFQNLKLAEGDFLYQRVAKKIIELSNKGSCGAVVGAKSADEFRELLKIYKDYEIPLLIPGVGSQGGSAKEVVKILKESAYKLEIVRINSSSKITHPWGAESAPKNYKELILKNLKELIEKTKI